ncbi:GNAT family N-acetyltransferase [Alteriqipengyuania flavescens]|uniref:GNAT family N-acetyltransferase n=1 Tax=Alteriqipengyuania flavescens TaxID=3053610 RepID=UPI0025B4EC0B|nr:GNAT family N-acetyltransferase [Alteriqipengyuania flavescens]WJY17522.1 GNAT family N-acetyltransferase [Alteriqipengyuania flavescens]WJY23465.1 GNAT family N-acetyltransferase [Alteriqipengyuania flavescens]
MTGWNIRLARAADAEALPDIEAAAGALFRDVDDIGTAGTHAISTDAQRAYIARGHCLVAEADGRIVGFVTCRPEGRELAMVELDVHPDHQKKGIGAALVRGCLIDAANAGFSAVTLTTFRHVPWNAPFYARLGFVEVEHLDTHPRLEAEIAQEIAHGLPAEKRVAMIKFLA